MHSIFQRTKAVFDNEYFHKSRDFKEGFRVCFQLFEIGYSKRTVSNEEYERIQAEKQLIRISKELENARKEIRRLNEVVKQYSVISPDHLTPLFAKRKTIMKIVTVLNAELPPQQRITELKNMFAALRYFSPKADKKAS